MILFCAVQGVPTAPAAGTPHFSEELIERIGRGDREALRELYEKTARAIYAFALAQLRDPEEAQDLMQDTFLKVRAAAHLYQAMGKPMAWLFTIARNLARTRQVKAAATLPTDGAGWEEDPSLAYVSDPEDRLVLQAALELLSEEERRVLLLHCVAGMKHRELARDLGQPLSTVLSRYNRALKKLRTYLEGQEGAQ
ncbi:RNA polymerase sigma factor [Allofournierella sp.]|uniref:RNA polymerase sigma factor n=1 Tax=Allofournierella sp. TaxID=1940256 RepID=UPI003AB5B61D